jgi:hypothetical protein
MLTNEQRQYYDELDAVFALPGWKQIVSDAEAQIYQNQADALESKTWDEVVELRGKSLSLNELIKLEMVSLAQRAMLEEEDDADL